MGLICRSHCKEFNHAKEIEHGHSIWKLCHFIDVKRK